MTALVTLDNAHIYKVKPFAVSVIRCVYSVLHAYAKESEKVEGGSHKRVESGTCQ